MDDNGVTTAKTLQYFSANEVDTF